MPLKFLPPESEPRTRAWRKPDVPDVEIAAHYNDIGRYPTIPDVARAVRLTPGSLRNRIAAIRTAVGAPPLIDRYAQRYLKRDAPASGPVQRWLLTAAQDDTDVHEGFWENLNAYARAVGAAIVVAPFTYNKAVFSDHETRAGFFRPEVKPHLRYDSLDLGPIVFCAEMNTLPTAEKPLSQLESYTGLKWGVFPHAKVQLISVPTRVGQPAKQIMTTGACTVPNYIAKKAGLKAEFHHVIGATIVEIKANGALFCRQINATSDGAFQDLDAVVQGGKVTRGHRVEAVNWGDIHREKLDPVVALSSWGLDIETDEAQVGGDTLIDTLRPRYQFFHDTLDFDARNHHRIDDHLHRFAMVKNGTDLVEDAMLSVARFLRETERDFCQSVVVQSNHDDALGKWLKNADFRHDPPNAHFFLRCQLATYDAINRGEPSFSIFRHVLSEMDSAGMQGIRFVDDDQSFLICQESGGIECAMHGHLGINGARGNAYAFTKTSVRTNRGHDHSPSIYGGVYTAGLSGMMDQGYNRGLSGWAHSHIITYPSGKRTLVTMWDGEWRG